MAFRPGFGNSCFGFFNPFCTTSTSASTQTAAPTTATANPGTITTTVVITNSPSPTTTPPSTPSATSASSQPSHTPSQAPSSSDGGETSNQSISKTRAIASSRRTSSTSKSANSTVSSSSSTGLGEGIVTVSQSTTATLTETSIQVITTSAAPGVLASKSSGAPSRGMVIGITVGGGICFLLAVVGAVILCKRMRRLENSAGHISTFRSSQFVLNSSNSKEPFCPGVEEGQGLTARSPTPSSTLSPLRSAPLSPNGQRSAFLPALTASPSTQWHSTASHSSALISPAPATASSPNPSDAFTEPVFHSRSPSTPDDNNFSPSAGTHLDHEGHEEMNTCEVDAGSVPSSVYRDVEGVYGTTQERAAAEPLPPAYDTLPPRRPFITLRMNVS